MARRLSDPVFPWDPEEDPAQIHLDTVFKLAVRTDYVEGILPYAKSIGFWLPGHGQQYATCGEIHANGCDNVKCHPEDKVFIRYYPMHCMRKECPVCFEAWAAGQSERALCRLVSYLHGKKRVVDLHVVAKEKSRGQSSRVFHELFVSSLERELKGKGMRTIHVVLSPDPDSPFDKKHYAKLRSEAYKIGLKSGLKGGLSVFHPYRLHCKICDVAIPDYQDKCPVCGDTDFWWVPSPHFHVVGFGWIHGTNSTYQKYGWVVRNLGIRKSVFWTMQYLLSHAGVFVDPEGGFEQRRFHTTTWFGALSYCKLKGVPDIEVPETSCPYCGRLLKPFEFVGLDRPPPDFDEEKPENNEFLDDLCRWRSL
jgi:hypothetical protein